MKMSLRSKVVIYALLVMVAIYFLSPFVYMLFSTFKTSAEAIAYPPSLFPKEWQWENYAKAWDAQPFGKYLLNSVIVTVLTRSALCSPARWSPTVSPATTSRARTSCS